MVTPTEQDARLWRTVFSIFRNFPIMRFLVVSLPIALADGLMMCWPTYPMDGQDMWPWQSALFLLLSPIWLPKLYLLHFFEIICRTQIMGMGSNINEFMSIILSGLGDVIICLCYFLVFRLVFFGGRWVMKNGHTV